MLDEVQAQAWGQKLAEKHSFYFRRLLDSKMWRTGQLRAPGTEITPFTFTTVSSAPSVRCLPV